MDIKPANVMIRKSNGWPVLIDFGVSKHYDYSGTQTSSTPVALSNGYAPIEQYMPGGLKKFSPQADIYSLGATLYTMVTGKVPPNAHEVMNMGLPLWNVPEVWRKLIGECMKPRAVDRLESIDRVQKLLSKVTMKEEDVKVDMSSDQVFSMMFITRIYPLLVVGAGPIGFLKPKLQDASNCVQILWLVAFFVYILNSAALFLVRRFLCVRWHFGLKCRMMPFYTAYNFFMCTKSPTQANGKTLQAQRQLFIQETLRSNTLCACIGSAHSVCQCVSIWPGHR